MAYSVIPKTKRDGVLKLIDGAANELEVSYTNGDLTFTPTKSAQVVIRSRGVIQNVRKGDDEAAASGSFSFHFGNLQTDQKRVQCLILSIKQAITVATRPQVTLARHGWKNTALI